jgi:O-acetyl-ADP-ribose deacetylase (regulator of RNase III)
VKVTDRLQMVCADITQEEVDAIVNAANTRLAHGGGVARAISTAAGPQLQTACDEIVSERGPLTVGSAVATEAFRLPCKKVIHTVGPIYGQHEGQEAQLLANAHLCSIEVAAEIGLKSISFPAISCGIYGYPIEEAAPIAISSTIGALSASPGDVIERVRFCFIDDGDRAVFERALAAHPAPANKTAGGGGPLAGAGSSPATLTARLLSTTEARGRRRPGDRRRRGTRRHHA